jgi:hypothetical protein
MLASCSLSATIKRLSEVFMENRPAGFSRSPSDYGFKLETADPHHPGPEQ